MFPRDLRPKTADALFRLVHDRLFDGCRRRFLRRLRRFFSETTSEKTNPIHPGNHCLEKRPESLVCPTSAVFHPIRQLAHHAFSPPHRIHARCVHSLLLQPFPVITDASRHRFDPVDQGSQLLFFRFVPQRAEGAVQFHLLRQLLPNRLPPWMAREALAQLTRHVESIQLEAAPSLEILPARSNPWSAVPVDDKKIPARIIGLFVHQKFLEAFPHLPLALMDVMALIHEFDP